MLWFSVCGGAGKVQANPPRSPTIRRWKLVLTRGAQLPSQKLRTTAGTRPTCEVPIPVAAMPEVGGHAAKKSCACMGIWEGSALSSQRRAVPRIVSIGFQNGSAARSSLPDSSHLWTEGIQPTDHGPHMQYKQGSKSFTRSTPTETQLTSPRRSRLSQACTAWSAGIASLLTSCSAASCARSRRESLSLAALSHRGTLPLCYATRVRLGDAMRSGANLACLSPGNCWMHCPM